MSEPFLERLSKFTADAGGLNRDALLFAAGRSSARPNRVWKVLATMLACIPGDFARAFIAAPTLPAAASTWPASLRVFKRKRVSSPRGPERPATWRCGRPAGRHSGARNPRTARPAT